MGGEWKLKKVSDVADVVAGGTPSTKNADYYGGDISWITPKDLSNHKDRYIKYGERSITQAGLEKSSAKLLPKDTILFTSRAPIGYVAIADQEVSTNQGFKNLVLKRGNDPEFFYYLLKHNVPLFERMASGSTFKEVSGQVVKDTELSVPGYSTQKKVAKILGSLDDKIELNRQTNETLEKIAQALFKSWFVDFDPVIDNALTAGNTIPDELQDRAARRQQQLAKPDHQPLPDAIRQLFPSEFELTEALGWVPMGWGVGSLDESIELVGGGTPKTTIDEYWGGSIPWFSVVDAPNDSDVFVINTEKYVTQEGVDNSSTRILRKGTTIISARGTVGKCALVAEPMAMNQSCYGIQGKETFPDEYVYYLIRFRVSDLQQRGHGSVFNTITRDTFESISSPLPSETVMTEFSSLVAPLFEKLLANGKQAVELAKLRDTLLPKLISGELRLPSDASADAEQPGTACAASS